MQNQNAEVSLHATIPGSRVAALLALLAERCGHPGAALRMWERTFRSQLPANQRGLEEVQVQSEGGNHILRSAAAERLAISRLVVPRNPPCLQARRVGRVHVDGSVPHFVSALGFELEHESLRRGKAFRLGAASLSVFELMCRKGKQESAGSGGAGAAAGGDDEWEVLGNGLWMVEVLVHGEDLKPLVATADGWANALKGVEGIVLQPVSQLASAGDGRKK